MAEQNELEVAVEASPLAEAPTEVAAPPVKTIEHSPDHIPEGAAATAEPEPGAADLSSVTTADLANLREELRHALQEEAGVLKDRMQLLQERRDLACRVEVAEAEELLTELTAQQERLQLTKLRVQLEELYF